MSSICGIHSFCKLPNWPVSNTSRVLHSLCGIYTFCIFTRLWPGPWARTVRIRYWATPRPLNLSPCVVLCRLQSLLRLGSDPARSLLGGRRSPLCEFVSLRDCVLYAAIVAFLGLFPLRALAGARRDPYD